MILFEAINFNGLSLFGKTEFNKFVKFEYVTFKEYTHFKDAVFCEGLNLEYSNIGSEINFFNIQKLDNKESKKNTSQETYRIIKYQLSKVGNIIESNKYHSLELKKRRANLPFDSLDYIVLFFHWISSNHSKSWTLALFWIFIVGIVTSFSLDCFICYSDNLNCIFKYISIVNLDECIKKIPIIFVINKVALGYLYYQFLTAVRKDTRK